MENLYYLKYVNIPYYPMNKINEDEKISLLIEAQSFKIEN